MASPKNEYDYAKEFVGNLRAKSEPVPVRVTTRLRVVMGISAVEVEQHKSRSDDAAPRYVVGTGNLPLHPSLQAMGRHYFSW